MGGRGSGGGRSGGGGGAAKNSENTNSQIKKGTPYLKNLNDPKESKALKDKTLNQIKKLQKRTNWWGDKQLNKIKDALQKTPDYKSEDILTLSDNFFNYKSTYMNKVKNMNQ